jgi:nucleoside-diphosphate-sugar epimerase
MRKTKVLVCGATGFIGRNLIEKFSLRKDMEVYGTYFKTSPSKSLLDIDNINLLEIDLTDKNQVDSLIHDKDVVVQASAVTTGIKDVVTRPYIHVTDNAVMNSIIFRSCFENKVKHVLFFSCTTMYPNQDKPVREEDFNGKIVDKYFGVGWTKVYIEKMCEFYSRICDTKFTAIRHSNIYGPHDKYDLERSHVFGATVTKVMHSKKGKFKVWGDGSEKRDLLYISDLVDFVETIIGNQKIPFELLNIGCGSGISIRHLVEEIIKISGKKLTMGFDTAKPTINFDLTLDIQKVRKKYNWEPKVSLADGIRKTISWYKENIYLDREGKIRQKGEEV